LQCVLEAAQARLGAGVRDVGVFRQSRSLTISASILSRINIRSAPQTPPSGRSPGKYFHDGFPQAESSASAKPALFPGFY
jgi:hypothetical protein